MTKKQRIEAAAEMVRCCKVVGKFYDKGISEKELNDFALRFSIDAAKSVFHRRLDKELSQLINKYSCIANIEYALISTIVKSILKEPITQEQSNKITNWEVRVILKQSITQEQQEEIESKLHKKSDINKVIFIHQ
jgi:ribosomal protein L18E